MIFNDLIKKLRKYISKIEPYWTIVGAPISQEVIFRFIPYQIFYLSTNDYWKVGLISSILYALIHWYFGLLITLGTLILGVILWLIMVNYGLLAAIALHALANVLILVFWKDKWLRK